MGDYDSDYPSEFTLISRTKGAPDSLGNDTWTTTETTFYGVLAPAGRTELIQGQDTVISHDTIYATPGAPVPAGTDQIIVNGVTRDLDGAPQTYRNPFTDETDDDAPGPVIDLMEVTG